MAMPNMKLISEFITKLEQPQAFWAFLYKMAGSFSDWWVLVIWDLNGYGEYEFDWWQSYGLYKRWHVAETAAAEETAA